MTVSIKSILRPLYRPIKDYYERQTFKKRIVSQKGKLLRIVVGSSGVYEEGWIPSEGRFLNLTNEKDWTRFFGENQIDTILAEHVWEHLTAEDGRKAVQVCFKFLKKGGRLRIAVPDGFHKDPEYIDYVKPGGHGLGSYDHKVLYNHKTLCAILEESGYRPELLEYFDEQKNFHANKWEAADGFIHRSIKHDERNADGQPHYTSLIVDGIKE